MTRQLLAFARRQVLQPQNLDLNSAVRETVSLIGPLVGEHIQFKLALSDGLVPAWADGTQVEQVIMNLCLNARDAMPNGGQIAIRTEATEIHPGDSVPQPYYRPGQYVLLTISDNGTGMDRETLEHVFEPFFTTKEVGKGTGLGLATVYGIVKQHGGIVDVQSELGAGTEFRVYLPTGSGTARTTEKKAEPAARTGTETVLIAEDHDGLREAAQEMLESQGYHVLLAASGDQAVEVFAANHNSIDLVLLDLIMPGMGGAAALERMLAIEPGLPAIFTTGYTAEADSVRRTSGNGTLILQKPYGSRQLGQAIRSLLDEVS